MARIIGLAGRARSGKDTIADYLAEHWGYTRLSFADPIRDGLAAMLGIDAARIDDKEAPIEGIGVSYRELAQTLGTEWGRNLINPDIWVLRLAQHLWYSDEQDKVVISDVRFPNEATWVRDNGIMVHVVRDVTTPVRDHISEAGIDHKDGEWVIYNNGSLDDLHHQIRMMMSHIEEAA